MSRASNSLRTSDVTATPIKLKYTASYDCSTLAAYGFSVLSGVNGPVTVTGSIPEETLNYRSVKQLYYANYTTGSFLTTSSSFDNFLQSTAASGTFDADLRYFPTESEARVTILSIPRAVFGEGISKGGFIMSSSAYYLVDDKNGNIVDQLAANIHVGNIIYPQGMAIITNPDYLDILPFSPTAIDDFATFTTTQNPKIVNVLNNDKPGTGTLLTSSVVLSGEDVALFTNNLNGTVTLNTNTVGTYVTYYTVQSALPGSCTLTSNKAAIVFNIIPAPLADCALSGSISIPEPLPVFGLNWTTSSTDYVQCSGSGWVISNENQTIRFNIADSANCGGTCNQTQSGSAEATITVGPVDVNMSLNFEGNVEQQDAGFENIIFKLNGTEVGRATSVDLNLGCTMGPVSSSFTQPPPYLLTSGSVYTFRIDFTTGDSLFHVNSYYQVDLGFTPVT